MKRFFQDYDMSTQLTAVITLQNSLFHPKYKQHKSRLGNVVHEICCNLNSACQDAYIGETSHSIVLNNTVHLVTMEMIQQSSST